MRYTLKRAGQSVVMIAVLMTLVFFGARVIGDPVDAMAPPGASEQARLDIAVRFGFDQPISVQFGEFVMRAIRLDFGNSMWQGTDALAIVLERLPNTLFLAGVTMLMVVPIAVLLGCLAAIKPGSRTDRIISFVSLCGVSMVEFWLGLLLIGFVSVQLGLLPTGGMDHPLSVLLPAATIAFRGIGRLAQFVRSAMIEELGKTYIVMARAKGMPEWRVFMHAGKNAAISITTMAADELSELVAGTMVVETVFAWPGMGVLIVNAIAMRDLFLLEATVFVIAIMIAILNLLADLSYTWLNPRIRYS
ncbi:ABC transporter permease [Paracoccus liaowanqingii]|uniref:ABC transporter permease n=1 Tax=Paracoccus liaowanqingii TaxID=2560053 RepID=A0A4Z1CRP5_9RHOB|nr:ABC transporter permease [Paracoccus liaowanqingii]TGN67757.1 ABC transporter permease [Paracoccus liaowanqingii]